MNAPLLDLDLNKEYYEIEDEFSIFMEICKNIQKDIDLTTKTDDKSIKSMYFGIF